MTAHLPLWVESGIDDVEAQHAREEARLIEAGEELLRRIEAEKVRRVVVRQDRQRVPDYAI